MKLELEGICKSYGKQRVLKEVSLSLEEGIYGILGKNGAGKTTLIHILLGLLKADAGRVRVDGRDVQDLGSAFFSQIGYLPQYPQFYKEFSVEDFLKYMCALKGVSKKEEKERIPFLLEQVHLQDAGKKKIGALSGGMRQRLGIAQAMLNDPKLLILDEPTAGLDPKERIRFRNLISRFAAGRIVLLVTHIVSDVEYIANRLLIMDSGEIVLEGAVEELEEALYGKVWEFVTAQEETCLDSCGLLISNVKREGENTRIRLLSEKQPEQNAVSVRASLDEVFLYCCRGDEE